MGKQWIDYKQLRESCDFAKVLQDYGVELKLKGDQHQGYCPLPDHQGQKRSPSFSANIARGIWQCFGCNAKGNVIDFVARMEGLNPEDKSSFRKAALILYNRSANAPPIESPSTSELQNPDEPVPVVNQPLDFELKRLDPHHPYLKSRNLEEETIKYFGLGYCKQGLMKGRIAIPLHDSQGRLVGYAGRLTEDGSFDEEHPKYKFPGKRAKGDTHHVFRKSAFLFNGHRIQSPVKHLIVVEGFFGVFWLHQCGWPMSVALMGSAISDEQSQLLLNHVHPSGTLWILTDGDDAGHKCANELLLRFSPCRFTRWVRLSEGTQPDHYSPDQLSEHFCLIEKSDPF